MLGIDAADELCPPQLGDVADSIPNEGHCVFCHSEDISSWHGLPWTGAESLAVHVEPQVG